MTDPYRMMSNLIRQLDLTKYSLLLYCSWQKANTRDEKIRKEIDEVITMANEFDNLQRKIIKITNYDNGKKSGKDSVLVSRHKK